MNAHFDGFFGAFADFGDLFVAHAFQGAQDKDEAQVFGKCRYGGFQSKVEFLSHQQVFGAGTRSGGDGIDFFKGFEGMDLGFALPEPVEALVGGDAVEPGAKGGFGSERLDVFEGGDEDFLVRSSASSKLPAMWRQRA